MLTNQGFIWKSGISSKWRNLTSDPRIKEILSYFKGMPASSVGVERFFSKFGLVYTDMRKSMTPETLCRLI